ncbi:MAG: heparan N-sulfatase, partial [Planctomycetes bacterium]|nr:heparan N-sulfatase [Planctomycetota bacterium]
MIRRHFLRMAGAAAATAAMPACLRSQEAAAQPVRKPNFLLIIADDLAACELGCYGGKNVRTPNIDKLAREGLRFTHAFASTSMCVPVRASLYTGLYPVRNTVTRNHVAARPGIKSVVHYLQALGYRVGLTGKVHAQPQSVFPFETVPGFEPNCTAQAADYTVDGIRAFMSRDPSQPFCLMVCSVLPHAPWTVGDESRFPADKLVLPPHWIDTPETRRAFAKYCAEVEALDRQVADVLRALDDVGRAL